MVIVGCGAVGLLVASTHRSQSNILRQFIIMLDYMECELKYRQTTLPELCQMAAQNSSGLNKTIFLALFTELNNQVSPDVERCMSAVVQTIDTIPKRLKDTYLMLGQSLGRFDLDGQLKGIEMSKAEAKRVLQEFTSNQENRIRCYQTLSICAGAAIAILFI